MLRYSMLGLVSAWTSRATRFVCRTLLMLLIASAARAADFRIDTTVHVEGKLYSRNTTIFRGGVVYDFLENPREVTVFEPANRRFLLLDPARQTQAEVSTTEVAEFIEQVKTEAMRATDPFLQFLAAPQFNEKMSKAGDTLTLSSPYLTYTIKCDAAMGPNVSQQYLQFSDNYARLNTMTNPAALPPFPRMQVNVKLAQLQKLPVEVQVTMRPKSSDPNKAVKYFCTHKLQRHLDKGDLERIEKALEQIRTYAVVTLPEYVGQFGKPVEQQARRSK